LGMEFIELSSLYLNNLELKTEAQPILRELSTLSLSDNTAFLATLQEAEVVYIDKMETFNNLRKYSIIGKRAPLYCTALGKSMLTGKTGEQIRQALPGRRANRVHRQDDHERGGGRENPPAPDSDDHADHDPGPAAHGLRSSRPRGRRSVNKDFE
jgi:DNA-binding IclR family transcriptional regulator